MRGQGGALLSDPRSWCLIPDREFRVTYLPRITIPIVFELADVKHYPKGSVRLT